MFSGWRWFLVFNQWFREFTATWWALVAISATRLQGENSLIKNIRPLSINASTAAAS
jgi:hypothetical protein